MLLLQVTVGHDAVSGGVLRQWEGLNMASLLPGMLVSVRIRQVCTRRSRALRQPT